MLECPNGLCVCVYVGGGGLGGRQVLWSMPGGGASGEKRGGVTGGDVKWKGEVEWPRERDGVHSGGNVDRWRVMKCMRGWNWGVCVDVM